MTTDRPNPYGMYGTESWRTASSEAGERRPPLTVDRNTGLELHVVSGLGGIRILVPPGTGRSMGLFSGPRAATATLIAEACRAGDELEADVISLPGLWADDVEASLDATNGSERGWSARLEDDGVAAVQAVGPGIEEMLDLVPKKERKPLRRRLRRLQELEGIEMRTIRDGPELLEAFATFVDMHNREWRLRGRQGHYADWPEAEALHRSMLGRAATDCTGMISGVFLRGDPVALQLGFVGGSLASAVNIARNPSIKELDQFSPATIAFIVFAAAAAELGADRVELGRGSYEYKRRLGAAEEPLKRILLVRSGVASSLRFGVARTLSAAFQRLYYRLWFSRICPRLGVRPGPLWWPWRMRV